MYIAMFTGWLLYTSVTAGILALIIFASKKLAKNILGSMVQYYIWVLIFIKLLVPSLPESHISIFNLFNAVEAKSSISEKLGLVKIADFRSDREDLKKFNQNTYNDTPHVKGSSMPVAMDKQDHSQYVYAVFIIWLMGVIILGAVTLLRDIKFHLKIRKYASSLDSRILKIMMECSVSMNIKRHVITVLTDAVTFPSAYGIFKPRILLPAGVYETLSEDELRFIILHELSHIKRQDIVVNCFIVLFKAVHWFNPVLQLAFKKMKADMEIACDAHVMSLLQIDDYKKYGLAIINLLRHSVR